MGWVLQGLAQWPQVCLLVDRVPDRKQQLNAKNCLLNTACPTAAMSRIHVSANAMTCWLWIFSSSSEARTVTPGIMYDPARVSAVLTLTVFETDILHTLELAS